MPQILPKKTDCIYTTRAYVFRAVSAAIGELFSKKPHTRRFLISSVLVLCVASGSDATDVQILPGNSPIKIKGKLGDDSTFIGGLDVMASVGIAELIFRSTDLRRSDGKEQIGRQQIALVNAGKLDLAANTPKYVGIKITGIKAAGTYQGNIYFLEPGKGATPALAVPIEVTAEGVPKLTLRRGSDALKIQLVKCRLLGCTLAAWFEPRAFVHDYSISFDDASVEPFSMTAAAGAMGEVTHSSLTGLLAYRSDVSVPSQPIFEYPISITDPRRIKNSPDHYVGDVQFKISPDSVLARIPLEVNVRAGPIVPLLVLLFGILLGRLLKYMKDKGGPQSDLLLNLYRLEARISASPADQLLLQPMLETVKVQIYGMELDSAKKELAAIENRAALLVTLRGLEQTLATRAGDPGVQPILDNIQTARHLVGAKQDQQAATLVAQVETAIQNLARPAPPAAAAFALAAAQAGTARVVAVRTTQVTAPIRLSWYVRVLSWATGISGALRAEMTLWVIRPLIYLLLVLALLALGMQQLYLKNATFGTDPVSDYLGILVWAMSSDVASRTLTSLKTGS